MSALLLGFLWGAGAPTTWGPAGPASSEDSSLSSLSCFGALNDTLFQQRTFRSNMWCNYLGKPCGLQRTVIKEQEIPFYRIERWYRDQTIHFFVDHIYLNILSSLHFYPLSVRTSLMTKSNSSKFFNHLVRINSMCNVAPVWFWLSKCHLPLKAHLAIRSSHY